MRSKCVNCSNTLENNKLISINYKLVDAKQTPAEFTRHTFVMATCPCGWRETASARAFFTALRRRRERSPFKSAFFKYGTQIRHHACDVFICARHEIWLLLWPITCITNDGWDAWWKWKMDLINKLCIPRNVAACARYTIALRRSRPNNLKEEFYTRAKIIAGLLVEVFEAFSDRV